MLRQMNPVAFCAVSLGDPDGIRQMPVSQLITTHSVNRIQRKFN